MSARSRRSSVRSRSSRSIALLCSSRSGSILLRTPGNSTSAGIMHSVPYTRAKGVSPVARLVVVRWDQRTPSSSSAHLPFLASKCFFSPSRMVLLIVSACPLRIPGRRLVKLYLPFFAERLEPGGDKLRSVIGYD